MKHKRALIVYGYMKVYECVYVHGICICVYALIDVCIVHAGILCMVYARVYMHNVCMCVHLSVKVCSLYAHMEARSAHQVLPLLLSTLVFKMRVNVLHVCLCSTSYVPGAYGGQKRVSDPLGLELYIWL